MTLFVTIAGVLGVCGAALASLWLRLRWHARQEEAWRQVLPTWVATLPLRQFEEVRPDGSRIRVTVAAARTGESGRTAEGRNGER